MIYMCVFKVMLYILLFQTTRDYPQSITAILNMYRFWVLIIIP